MISGKELFNFIKVSLDIGTCNLTLYSGLIYFDLFVGGSLIPSCSQLIIF